MTGSSATYEARSKSSACWKTVSSLFNFSRLRRYLPLGLACGSQMARGENHADFGYEYYIEDDNRIAVRTYSIDYEQKLLDWATIKGDLTYDGISGSTPTGTYYYPPGDGKIRTTKIDDIRRAMSVQVEFQAGIQTITPGFSYSDERDYESYGISLSDAIAFNEKNTILNLGFARTFDSVLNYPRDGHSRDWQEKETTDGLIGISQLLTPNTIFSADFTFGYASGFLSDPYRQTEFVYPGHKFGVVRNENRPSDLYKQTLQTSITYYIESMNGSIEASYRFYHDSYEIYANTLALTWHQWFGQHLILEPTFRFYEQGAASFYEPLFHTDPANLQYYSSDYRLSEFYSLYYGAQLTVVVNSHLHLIAGYHRYTMTGLDDTVTAMYPQANVYTLGASLLW
jgi:hypothetical protein